MTVISEETSQQIKDTLHKLTQCMKDQKKHCEYSGCVVQYAAEHWHIDQHTLTFRNPKEDKTICVPPNAFDLIMGKKE